MITLAAATWSVFGPHGSNLMASSPTVSNPTTGEARITRRRFLRAAVPATTRTRISSVI